MESLISRQRMSKLLFVLLRVPPIIVMDMISNSKHCISLDGWRIFMALVNFLLHIPLYLQSKSFLNELSFPKLEDTAYFSLQTAGYLGAFLLFSQRTNNLVIFYLLVAAVGVIIWSYILNVEYVKYCSDLLIEHSSLQQELFALNKKALQAFFFNYLSQTFLAIVFCFSTMSLPNFPRKKFLVGVLFIFPTLINAALPSTVLTVAPDLVTIVTFLVFIYYLAIHLRSIPRFLWLYAMSWRFSFQFVRILNRILFIWTEFHVTSVLQTFALFRLVKNLMFLTYDYLFTECIEMGNFSMKQLIYIFEQLTVMSTENIIAICGITSILSLVIDKTVYNTVQKFLTVPELEQNSISPMFTKLLVLLCIQFGVTSLEPEQRLNMMSNISWMMGVSVLSKINLQICKQLVSVTLIGSLSYKKHIRVLILAFLTLFICMCWLAVIFQLYIYETWLFPVALFNIEILITVIISLVIYILNFIHFHSHTVWYELYDYIYYLESTKNVISLFLSVLVLIKGFYKLIEVGSILRLVFLFLHFYYYIWCQLLIGQRKWMMRRIIYHCVNSLPLATNEEVTEMGGSCAICLNDVCRHIICITRCNHFFHSYCLRKWLCERNICPICYRVILPNTTSRTNERRRLRPHQE